MLIDEKTSKVMLSRSVPGMEHILPLMASVWKDLHEAGDNVSHR